jgi:hypothetical protein
MGKVTRDDPDDDRMSPHATGALAAEGEFMSCLGYAHKKLSRLKTSFSNPLH